MNTTDTDTTRGFNPNDHLMQLKSKEGPKDYLPVQWRLVWFREQCPEGTIETELIQLDLDRDTEEEGYAWNDEKKRSEKIIKHATGYALFKATVKDGKGGIATGYKSEKAAAFPDFTEKAETGAIGRALAALGYGTQFAPELDTEHRIVDAPVNNGNSNAGSSTERAQVAHTHQPQMTADTLKAHFAKSYRIAPANLEEKWKAFKVHVLHEGRSDGELAPAEMARIHGEIIAHEKGIDKHTKSAS